MVVKKFNASKIGDEFIVKDESRKIQTWSSSSLDISQMISKVIQTKL